MKKLLPILLCFFLIFGCNFENNKSKTPTEESKTAITYERSYGPKLIEYVWDGDRRTERYDMNDSVIEVERIYINGVLDSSTEFYGTGNLWFQTQYKDGIRHGNHVCYNEDKTVKYTQVYENDSLISDIEKTYYENGKLQSEITTHNDTSNELSKLYYESGKLHTKGFLKNGKSHGLWSVYYESGTLKIQGKWKDDKPNGIWRYYDERGWLIKKREYLNGELIKEQPLDAINDLDKYNLNIARELGHCYDELTAFEYDPEIFYPICSTNVRVFFLEPNYYCVYIDAAGWCGSCGCSMDIYKKINNEYEELGLYGCIGVDINQPINDYIIISDLHKTSYCWTSHSGKYNIKDNWLNLFEIVDYEHKIHGLESDVELHMDTCKYANSSWLFE